VINMDNPQTDLFGDTITLDKALGVKERKTADRRIGYLATPSPIGSAQTDETCKTCQHSYKRAGGTKSYWKCGLMKPSHGKGTDIRLRWAACSRWEAKESPSQ